MARRDVSEGRKTAYYLGMIISGIGLISFLSVFFTVFGIVFSGFSGSGNPIPDFSTNPGQPFPGPPSNLFASIGIRAIGGFILIIVGQGLRGLGARGLAGSGVILDPEKAREDLEPWSRMAGGMVKDAVDEAGVDLGHALNGSHSDNPDMPFDEKLRRLHQLRLDGIISNEEYEREKSKILDEQ